ncbi:unnamed protein product [Lactuca saligna]|uniref:pyridoxal kinase n=1 Tax=Lactuca saligna TaxID=75948 RepID=A0AA35YGV1_LACSI|nr:unnamed protein product [Lactuca saligna]
MMSLRFRFLTCGFKEEISEMEASEKPPSVRVGNLEILKNTNTKNHVLIISVLNRSHFEDYVISVEVLKKLRSINPTLTYVCDPVMGDEGRLYVPQELMSMYREKVVPVTLMLTPNLFEAEQLTGFKCF